MFNTKLKNMLKILFFLLFLPFSTEAQNNTVASGANAFGATGSATYTVGQVFFVTNSSNTGTALQGLQQPFEITTLNTTEIPEIQLIASVYPNPTTQNVTLSVKNYDLTDLKFTLYGVLGKVIRTDLVLQEETPIDLSNQQAGLYFLKINNTTSELKTFKIIKK